MATHKKPTVADLEHVAAAQMAGDTQKPDERSTDTTQATHERSTSNTLKRYDVRFNPDDWEWLKQHFQAKGLPVSAGLRMIAKEYIDRDERQR